MTYQTWDEAREAAICECGHSLARHAPLRTRCEACRHSQDCRNGFRTQDYWDTTPTEHTINGQVFYSDPYGRPLTAYTRWYGAEGLERSRYGWKRLFREVTR